MKSKRSGLMAVLSIHALLVSMFLSIVCLSGVLADCNLPSRLSISAPKKIEALSGSCLIVPCSFTVKLEKDVDEREEILGLWIRSSSLSYHPKNVSNKTTNQSEVKILGNLKGKDCTTEFLHLEKIHPNIYFFRIKSQTLDAIANCHPVQMIVTDSPQSPSIEIPADLKEEASVSITCSAPTPCPHSPPELTWNLQPDSQRQTERNPDGSFTTKIQKIITLSDIHDGLIIRCSARYPVNEGTKTAETHRTLSVSYAPKKTSASISPSGLVSAGSWVTMTCSSRAKPAVSDFGWFRISKHGDEKVAEGESYSLNATEGGNYYSVATNDLGNQTSPEIHLTVGDNLQFGIVIRVSLRILGILTLFITVIIFECFFSSR